MSMSGAAMMALPPPAATPVAGRLFFVHAAGAPQSIITLRGAGPARTSPDFYAAELTGAILAGDSITSRIGRNLREMRGYAYSLGGNFAYNLGGGSYFLTAPVRTDATAESVVEVLEEIRMLRETGVTMEELERERRGRVAGVPYLFETAGLTLSQYDLLDAYGLPFTYFADYARNFEAVTPAATQQVAAKYLAPASLQVLVVGDGPSVLSKLRAMTAMRPEVMGGEVIILDGEGRPTTAP
jgi:predicted Zn-dependent peptidase